MFETHLSLFQELFDPVTMAKMLEEDASSKSVTKQDKYTWYVTFSHSQKILLLKNLFSMYLVSFYNHRIRKLTYLCARRKPSVEIREFQELLVPDNHKEQFLINNLAMKQSHMNRQSFNCSFYKWELQEHGMDILQAHQCLKDQLNHSLYEAILEDITTNHSWVKRLKRR